MHVSIHLVALISAETGSVPVTPVPDRHDRAPVSFCRNRFNDENNVIHIKKFVHVRYATQIMLNSINFRI